MIILQLLSVAKNLVEYDYLSTRAFSCVPVKFRDVDEPALEPQNSNGITSN